MQDSTNLIFECTNYRAHKMVLHARLQKYGCFKNHRGR